jgi:shikimate kinase
MRITITGPRSAGKTTISKLVAEKLKLKLYSSDEIGEKNLKKQGGLDKAIKSGEVDKFIKDSAYGLIRGVYKEDNFVFEVSGGAFCSSKFVEVSEKVRNTAREYSTIVGLLPSEDIEESIAFLFEREKEREHFKEMSREDLLFKTRKSYLKFPPIFKDFCNVLIYTKDKTPDEITDEIISRIKD